MQPQANDTAVVSAAVQLLQPAYQLLNELANLHAQIGHTHTLVYMHRCKHSHKSWEYAQTRHLQTTYVHGICTLQTTLLFYKLST